MILFVDTSALFKLYVDEADSDSVHSSLEAASAAAVCRIARAEAMSALARRSRESPGDQTALETAKRALRADWSSFLILEVTQDLVEQAGDFAETFALRGYDAVQLAAANMLRQQAQQTVIFGCFERRLCRAESILGMELLPGPP